MNTRKAWRRRFSRGAMLVGGALAASACAEDAPLDTLNPAGPIARQIDGLWDVVFWLAVAVFVVVEGLIVVAIIRFRQRKGDDSKPEQTHGNTRLEIAWTIAPAILLAALAFPTVSTIFALAREPADAVPVTVTAHQWWWHFEYPEQDVVTANELHIPTGQPVRLTLRSDDIIHSFWVPRLAGKQDMVPGRTNHLNIEADEPGTYQGTCMEYCGLSHANMRFKVIAHDPADYERWLSEQLAPPAEPTSELEREGKRIFEAQACVGCHTIEGVSEATTGPNLTHFGSRTTFAGAIFRNDEESLREWLADAPGMKPGAKMPAGVAELGLTEDDITALVAYLQSLE